MKILYVINGLIGGGAEKLMNDLLPMINESGNECELLVLSLEGERYLEPLTARGVKVRAVEEMLNEDHKDIDEADVRGGRKASDKSAPAKRSTSGRKGLARHIASVKCIDRVIREGHYDIVHVNLFPSLYYCGILKKLRYKNMPFFYTEHSTDNKRRHKRLLRPLEKFIYGGYDGVIAISRETAKSLGKWLGKPVDRIDVIENGVVLEDLRKAEGYDRSGLIGDVGEDDVIIGMVGSFTRQKNHAFMLEVMKLLPENHRLLLVGEGGLQDEISERVKALGLESRVAMLGFRKDVASILKAVDVVVAPSIWEGFGLAAVEAMACGKIVVCSDVPGLSSVVGDAGIRVDIEGDGAAKRFADAVVKAYGLCCSQECVEACTRQAAQYDIARMCERYLAVYEKALAR